MGDPTLYTVDNKEELRKLGKGGEVEVHYRIWATTKKGTYFHVDVPEDELDKADEVLTARAKQLDSI
jgi:hypothetical protein